jgi:hypothetical protein
VILPYDADTLHASQDDVVAAVVKALDVGDDAAAPDRKDRRPALVARFPFRLDQHHRNQAVALQDVRDHLAIARLEDVQREEHVRKQHHVREREQGKQVGHTGSAKCKMLNAKFNLAFSIQHLAV